MIKIAVDAMGGDYAPGEMVKGAVEALKKRDQVSVVLVGQKDKIEKELEGCTYPQDRLSIVHASEVIETGEPPVIHCGGNEPGKEAGGRCICVSRKFRSNFSRRPDHCGKDKRGGASSSCAFDSHQDGSVPAD